MYKKIAIDGWYCNVEKGDLTFHVPTMCWEAVGHIRKWDAPKPLEFNKRITKQIVKQISQLKRLQITWIPFLSNHSIGIILPLNNENLKVETMIYISFQKKDKKKEKERKSCLSFCATNWRWMRRILVWLCKGRAVSAPSVCQCDANLLLFLIKQLMFVPHFQPL